MISWLITLSSLALGVNMGNLSSIVNVTVQKTNIFLNQKNSIFETKTEQDTIYIDKVGKQVATNQHFLTDIDSKEIIQIGFIKMNKSKFRQLECQKQLKKYVSNYHQK
ncbi:hypothetical protein [Spiroplasma endosymbiont of Notiophilus biguttatus]|uniref:hypothetical protein n=1 Tax=Spiroplasma endosymbiont of Notiophilus biguttatus TaxID=3066285 RepID=UPI00313E6B52